MQYKTLENDNVNHPKHYQSSGSLECIQVLQEVLSKEEFEGFCRGNIIKYLWRSNQKNGLEDLKKAQWYLNKLIDTKEKEITQ